MRRSLRVCKSVHPEGESCGGSSDLGPSACSERPWRPAEAEHIEHIQLVTENSRKFFYHHSTELREPLNAILGFSTLALEHPGQVPPEVRPVADILVIPKVTH
jgi:hypothetical protein